jgi:hypothetical protein
MTLVGKVAALSLFFVAIFFAFATRLFTSRRKRI